MYSAELRNSNTIPATDHGLPTCVCPTKILLTPRSCRESRGGWQTGGMQRIMSPSTQKMTFDRLAACCASSCRRAAQAVVGVGGDAHQRDVSARAKSTRRPRSLQNSVGQVRRVKVMQGQWCWKIVWKRSWYLAGVPQKREKIINIGCRRGAWSEIDSLWRCTLQPWPQARRGPRLDRKSPVVLTVSTLSSAEPCAHCWVWATGSLERSWEVRAPPDFYVLQIWLD